MRSALLLQKRIVTKVATRETDFGHSQEDGQSQRVLEEASEGFQIIRETRLRARRDVDHRQADRGGRYQPDYPAGGYDDLTALQRRASDIHIENRDDSVVIKFRIDGVLTQAMPPIAGTPFHR